jgi:predicted amidophosphoribosyltransferase
MILKSLKSLISPRVCLFCSMGESYLCANCFEEKFVSPQFLRLDNVPTLAMSRYQDLVRELVVRHKDHHFVAIREYLASSLYVGIKLLDLPKDCLILSIPTAKKQIRERMDDPVKFMVAQAAKQAGLASSSEILMLNRSKKDQVGLNANQRSENTKNIFSVKSAQGKVAVLDDVVTSGATLRAANHALASAGYQVLANICVSNTPKTRD